MVTNRFNEKQTETVWDDKTKSMVKLEVWQSPKYLESKRNAEKFIDEKHIVEDSDFWILMNKTKSGKMAYTGLIISHNGCLKINDTLDKNKFKPSCITREVSTFGNTLVFTYCDPETGIYEVGEVNQKNCSNAYPFAMAFKRCFDRVVLKACKLAYAGIYSDSEADEFTNSLNEPNHTETPHKQDEKPTAPKNAPQRANPTEEEVRDLYTIASQWTFKSGKNAGKKIGELSENDLKYFMTIDNQMIAKNATIVWEHDFKDSSSEINSNVKTDVEVELAPLTDEDLPF